MTEGSIVVLVVVGGPKMVIVGGGRVVMVEGG